MASLEACCLLFQGGGTDTDGDSDGSCDSAEFRRGGGAGGGGRRGRGGGDDAADLMAQTLEVRSAITLFRLLRLNIISSIESRKSLCSGSLSPAYPRQVGNFSWFFPSVLTGNVVLYLLACIDEVRHAHT